MEYREPEFLPWDGRRVPITFIGGYLGAGKTTAINEVLAYSDRPIAVIVNDVGAINIDAELIRKRHGDTIELTNGCVCCGSINEMGAAFDQLRARAQPPDHVLVELSGVADPQRMLPWGESAGFMLDGIVIVVAANQLDGHGDDALPEWIQSRLGLQISLADLLILTKTDLVDKISADAARSRLAELAPGIPVFLGGRDLAAPGALGRFLSLGARRPITIGGAIEMPSPTLFDAHEVQLVPVPTGLSLAGLDSWLAELTSHVSGQLVRAKGVVATAEGRLVRVHIVGSRTEITELPQPEIQQPTDLVVISLRV